MTAQRDDDATADVPPQPQPQSEPKSHPEPERPRTRPGALWALIVATVLALGLDATSKAIVVAKLPEGHRPVRILGGVFYLDQTRNSGAAFSLGTGFTVVLTVVALVVVAVIVRAARRLRSIGWAIALGLILGGALGNLADRFFRAPGVGRGRVVDWISLFGPNGAHWPIFNLADAAIVGGAILAALLTLVGVELSGRRARREE